MAGVAAGGALRLTTPRFLLRDVVPADEAAFVAYQTDPSFARFHDPGDTGAEVARALFRRFLAWAAERPRQNWQLAVVDRDAPGALLGTCGLRGAGLPAGEAEFGIELAPRAQGRHGAAVEIARGMLAFGFAALRLRRIRAVTVDANAVAGRLAAHMGFQVAGPPPGTLAAAGQPGWTNSAWLLTRERWERHGARPGRDGREDASWHAG